MADDGAQEWTPEDYDREITRLQQERDKLQKQLDDPEQQKLRRTRRAQIVGDYAAHSVIWNNAHMDGIRKVADKTGEDWLFKANWLQIDGWSRDDKGNWHPPKS